MRDDEPRPVWMSLPITTRGVGTGVTVSRYTVLISSADEVRRGKGP